MSRAFTFKDLFHPVEVLVLPFDSTFISVASVKIEPETWATGKFSCDYFPAAVLCTNLIKQEI